MLSAFNTLWNVLLFYIGTYLAYIIYFGAKHIVASHHTTVKEKLIHYMWAIGIAFLLSYVFSHPGMQGDPSNPTGGDYEPESSYDNEIENIENNQHRGLMVFSWLIIPMLFGIRAGHQKSNSDSMNQ